MDRTAELVAEKIPGKEVVINTRPCKFVLLSPALQPTHSIHPWSH